MPKKTKTRKGTKPAPPPDLLGDDAPDIVPIEDDVIPEDADAAVPELVEDDEPEDAAPAEDRPKPKRGYQPNPVVQEVPAICRRCGCTESTVTKTTKFPHRPLRIGDNEYPGRIVRRRTCKKCGLHFVSSAPFNAQPPPPGPPPCPICDGVGMWAPDRKTPWSEWIKDFHNAARVSATGLKPGVCANCRGSGKAPEPPKAESEPEDDEKSPTP